MDFCHDAELLAWEPGVFLESAFAHQALVKEVAGTVTGTALVMAATSLGNVVSGMVAQVTLADGSLTQLAEIASATDSTHAVISALRGRSSESAIPPLTQGPVKVTVISFRPQISAVGDSLLSLVGVASDRDSEASPTYSDASGFKPAAIFGTLAAIYRTLVETHSASSVTFSKKAFYEGLFNAARQTIAATVDQDGDGIPETRVQSAAHTLERV
jgi:hypothetical protein